VLGSAPVLGAIGDSVEVLAPAQGWSVRGPSDDQRLSGAVLRKPLVTMAPPVDPQQPVRVAPYEPSVAGKVRQRASRRAVKGPVAAGEAEARGPQVATHVGHWDNARVGNGRRSHRRDTTRVEVPLERHRHEATR
jgi:hypothetical protein